MAQPDANVSDSQFENEIDKAQLCELVNDINLKGLGIKEINDEIKKEHFRKNIVNESEFRFQEKNQVNAFNDKDLILTPLNLSDNCWDVIYKDDEKGVHYRRFARESDLDPVIELITKDLSEPYSIYTYRYFIYNWPQMCILAMVNDTCVGAVVGKIDSPLEIGLGKPTRGYIAMLAVREGYRRLQIGSRLVQLVIETMIAEDCREIVLETEITNRAALALYEKLGFLRDKRLFRYYLNGVDAYRLKLWIPE